MANSERDWHPVFVSGDIHEAYEVIDRMIRESVSIPDVLRIVRASGRAAHIFAKPGVDHVAIFHQLVDRLIER